jgi:proline racemase
MISAVDAHACGEPGRVIVGGVLDIPGATMFEKMKYLETRASARSVASPILECAGLPPL